MRRLFLLLVLAVFAVSCEGDAVPSTPAGPVSTVGSSTSSTTVAPTSSSASSALPEWPGVELLVTNDDGVFYLDASGEVTQLVKGRVAYAVDDTRGGLLFQVERGRSYERSADTRVWWVPQGSDRAQELLVPTPGLPQDLALYDSFQAADGGVMILYIRHDSTWDPEAGPFTFVDSLRTYTVESGVVTELLSGSGYEAGLGPASGSQDVVSVTLFDQVGSSCGFLHPSDGSQVPVPGAPVPDLSCEWGCPWGCVVSDELDRVAYSKINSAGNSSVVVSTESPQEVEEFEFTKAIGSIDIAHSYLLVNHKSEWGVFDEGPATLVDLESGHRQTIPVTGLARFATSPVAITAPVIPPTPAAIQVRGDGLGVIDFGDAQEPPPGYAELHLVWQVDSVEHRQNPIEPLPITEDCLFDDMGIEVGDVYQATIAYQEPLLPDAAETYWPFGPEYPLSLDLGDLTLTGQPGGALSIDGINTHHITHYFHAAKYGLLSPPDMTSDYFEIDVLNSDMPGGKGPCHYSFQWYEESGRLIEVGEPLVYEPAFWDTNLVQVYWHPNDGSICHVIGSLVDDPTPLIESLIDKIDGLDLPSELADSLTAKLNAAVWSLRDSNPIDDTAALNLLEAFINEVEAQAGKNLSDTEAEDLLSTAGEVLKLIRGESEPEYTMVDLGTLGSGIYDYSTADAINNRGQVVGDSEVSFDVWHLFLWEKGEMVDLGVPPGGTPDFVWPRAINNRGMVVGTFRSSEIQDTAAFVFRDGEWTVILPADAYWTNAVDVNASGQVLGLENPVLGDVRLFVWENGVTTYLDLDLPHTGPFAPHVVPVDLTDRGEVVGYYDEYGPVPGEPPLMKSFVWRNGEVELIVAPGAEKTEAVRMNTRGQVVGQYYTGPAYGSTQAFVWEDGLMTHLPGLGGDWTRAGSINNRGQIVGTANTPNGETHAVLWQDGVLVDLGSHDGSWHGNRGCEASDINDHGQVVGFCWTDLGPRAFLWER